MNDSEQNGYSADCILKIYYLNVSITYPIIITIILLLLIKEGDLFVKNYPKRPGYHPQGNQGYVYNKTK